MGIVKRDWIYSFKASAARAAEYAKRNMALLFKHDSEGVCLVVQKIMHVHPEIMHVVYVCLLIGCTYSAPNSSRASHILTLFK